MWHRCFPRARVPNETRVSEFNCSVHLFLLDLFVASSVARAEELLTSDRHPCLRMLPLLKQSKGPAERPKQLSQLRRA